MKGFLTSKGGGDKHRLDATPLQSLTSQKVFKPLIASSLALALGVSVAVANPTITTGDSTTDISDSLGITWQQDSNGNAYTPQNSDGNSAITQLFLSFNSADTNEGTTEGSNGYAIKASSAIRNLTLTSDKTINMGESGSLEMRAGKYLSGANDKIITLDLSGVTGENYALIGNFKTGGGAGNTNIANFGGNGINGSVTLDGSASTEMYFTGNAGKITGALSITQNSTNIISFESGGSIGSFTATNGNSTINNLTYIYNNSGTNANDVVTIGSGTNVLNFLDNGVITGNVNFYGGTTTMTNLATINGNIKATAPARPGYNNYSTLTLSNTVVNGDITLEKITYWNHYISIFGVKSVNNISARGEARWTHTKKLLVVFSDQASVKGDIETKDEAITELIFSQATSATLQGNNNSAIDITAKQTEGAYGNYSKNVLIFGANTTAKIGTMSTSGDWGGGDSSGATFNVLSFNDDTNSNTNVTINAINSYYGRTIIGKDIVNYNSSVTYSDALFGNGGYKQKIFNASVTEFVKSTHSASGTFTFGDNSAGTITDAIVANLGGKNYINANGNTTIKGNILSSVTSSSGPTSGHNNLIVLTGTSATLGEDSKAISIKVANNEGQPYDKTSNNTLLLGATTNTLTLSALSASGTYNSDANQNFNALSINSGTTTATITSISAGFGTNIIGKDLITQGDSDGNGSGYNTALFGSNADTPVIQSGFIAEFVKSTHSASGTFTFGDNSTSPITDAISTSQGGLNYINVSGTTTIKGNILSSTQGSTGENNNLIVLTGTSATLGEDSNAISIKVENSIGAAYERSSNNTLLLGADSNTLNLSALSANGTYNSDAKTNFNALSFNNATNNGDKTLGTISAGNGSNIIGKDLITQGDSSGYNTTLFGNANTPAIQRGSNNFASTFMSDAHTAKGTYNITSITIENTVMGGNYINVENLTITGGVKASSTNMLTSNERFVENYIYTNGSGTSSISGGVSVSTGGSVDTKNVITFAGSGANSIEGEISASGGSNNISLANNLTTTDNITKSDGGANYFTFIGNGTLTLQGETNQISTLTAYAPSTRSTSASTLVIDSSTQSNNTTIDRLTNGGNLIVKFTGSEGNKTATLTISSLTGNTLKAITLGENAANNTLDLTALRNTTISEKINVGANQGLNLKLNNTALTTSGWSNAGNSTIIVNGNSSLQGGVVELTGLTLQNSSAMTLKNTNTTITTLTTNGTNTLTTSDGSTTITDAITIDSSKNLTLALSSDTSSPSDTLVTLNGTISGANVSFSGGVNPADQVHFSELLLRGNESNALANVTTSATNAKITLDSANTTISALSFQNNGSMLLGFTGTGNSTLTLSNSVSVESGQALGISIGGSGTRTLSVAGSITFNSGSTLIVDFQRTQAGDNITATLGSNQSFNIGNGSNSIINLRGGEGNSRLNGNIELTGGTNTINFIDTATMGDVITLTRGNNIINVYGSDNSQNTIIGTMAVSRVGGVNNTINLENYSTLNLTNSSGMIGSGELKTTATNILNFNGINTTLQGGFGAENGGNATINVKNLGAKITGNATSVDVSFSDVSNSTLTLQGTTNTLNTLNSSVTGSKLILDAMTESGVSAEIKGQVTDTSAVGLKFGSGGNAKKFIFSAQNNTLSGVEFDENGSTNNTLSFTKSGNSITSDFVIGDNQGLTLDLQDGSDLSIVGFETQGNGVANLQSTGATTLKGGVANANTLTLLNNATNALTLQNSNTMIDTLTAQGTSNTLKLDGTNNAVNMMIRNTLSGDNLEITLAGANTNNTAILTLNGANNTIGTLSLGTNSTNNTLILNNGATKINNAMNVEANQGIAFDLTDETILSFTDGLTTNATGTTTFNLGSSNVTSTSTTISGTLSNSGENVFNVNSAITTLKYGENGLSFSSGNNKINFEQDGSTLKWQNISNSSNDIATGGTSQTSINFNSSDAILATGISTNGASATTTIKIAEDKSGVIQGAISTTNGATNVNFAGVGTLTLQGENNQLTSVSSTTSGTLSLDGASNENGVSASVLSAIVGNTTTLNFNGANGKKAEMTLGDGGNELKAITLGSNAVENKLILTQGDTSIESAVNVGANQALAFDLANGTTLALSQGLSSSNGGTSLFNVKDSASSTINGNITLSNNGVNNATIGNNGTLTLQGENNQLTSVSSTTSGTLSLDGASNENGVSASVSNAITGNSTTLNFNGANGKKAEMTLDDGGNELKAITLGDSATNNKLILSTGSTSVTEGVNVGANQALAFDLGDGVNLALVGNLANAGESEINFNGSNGILISSISTTAGATTIKIAEDKSGVIQGAISTTDGATNVNFAGIGTLTLQGENNQLTSVTSTTSGTLSLDGASNENGVSASVLSAIVGNTTTLNFNGANGKKAEMTLSDCGNFLKAITLGSNAVENKLILTQGDTSIESAVNVGASQALTFDLGDGVNLILADNLANAGESEINFNGSNGILISSISTTAGATTIKIAEDKSGVIQGAISTTDGATNVNFAGVGTLTLQGENNQLTSVSSTTSGILSLNGAGVSASVSNAIIGNSTTLDFNGRTGKKAEMTLNASGNFLKAITLGSNAVENKLILSQGDTSIQSNTTITTGQALTFDLKDGVNLINTISNIGGNTNLEFNGINGTFTGTLSTSGGATTIKITESKSGTITGAVTTDSGAITTIDFSNGSNVKSLNLQGADNTITTISSNGSNNTLNLDTTRNGVSVGVTNAISGANSLTIALGGATDKKVELTLNNANGDSTLKALTLANASAVEENVLNLNTRKTTIADNLSIDSGKGMTINLADNTELASGIANSGNTIINFNGTTSSKLTGDISTDGSTKITTFNIATGGNGVINGSITLSNSGANNATIGENGTLTLQGENNQLTSVTSTTSGTLSLDGASNENGVSASVLSAIVGNTTTLNFNGANGKKAEMTLGDDGNELKAITLGDSATNNKLILSTGSTSVTEGVNVGANQALTFDLKDGVNLTLMGNLANAGESEINFNGSGGILTGAVNTSTGTTTIKIAESKSGTITGAVTTDSGAITTIDFSNGSNVKSLNLQGADNTITTISSNGSNNTLNLDTTRNGVSVGVTNAISGANSLTIALGGATDKKVELTLNNANGDSTLKALTLANASAVEENVLNLNTRKTTIADNLSIDSGKGMTINLADNTELASGIANSGNTIINFNGTTSSKLTGDISTDGSTKTTTFNIATGGNGVINGSITLSNSGANNATIGENGTLTLQGENNQLTSVSSTTSGTLSLDGASNENGVSASVSNAITGNSTTLNFNGRTDKKAEMTLNASGNFLKAITLGSNAVENKLILTQGDTSIESAVNVGASQALAFDLANGTTLALSQGLSSSNGGTSLFNVKDSASSTINGNITLSNNGVNNVTIGNNGTLTLQGENNQLTSVSSTTSGTLSLDGASNENGVTASVSNAITGNSTTLDFNGANGKKAEMTLSDGGNFLKAITLGSNAVENKLILTQGDTSIESAVSVEANQALAFDLGDGVELLLSKGMQSVGKSYITIPSNSSASISGENGNIEIDTINLGNIQGRLRSLNVYSTLTLNNPQTTTIKNFNPISDTSSIILKNGEVVIANPLSINQDKILNFTFNQPSTLTFEKNISNNGVLRFNFNESGILVLKEVSQENSKAIFEINLGNENNSGVNASIEDNTPISNLSINIHSKNTALQYGDTQGLIFSQGTNEITFMGDQTSLEWKNLNGAKLSSIQTTGGITNVYFNGVSTEIDKNNYALLDCGLENNGGELNIVLGSTTQNSIQSSHAKINNDIITTNNAKTKISFGSEGNILFLGGNTNTISAIENYSNSTNNTISLANIDEFGNDSVGNSTRGEYKTLLINGDNEAIKGENLHFVVYVNPDSAQSSNQTLIYGDRIIIDTEAIGKESKNHNLSVVFSKGTQLSELENLKRGISIATVKKLSTRATSDTSEDALIFNSEEKAIFGFNLATLKFNPVETDINGQSGSGYTTYFLTKAINNGVIVAEQEITATAFTLNYDLYMANLNSLNKRMGELRENNHSQGVWARVFNGALSNDFGLGSKSNYTTIQAGYDYAFGFEGANNYLGVALSYALSTSTSNNYAFDENRQKRGIDGIYSNAVEVALYNSYVSDRGWYNDSIAKFSYIMSKFNINNLNNNTSTSNDTSNFALTLSDEVGYVFKLGESKEWSITPQVEATFGYFNQSNFKQTLVNSSDFLNSSADAVLTLRTRVGSAFGYDFKAFTQKDTFNASLYVGAFYEYDYVSGGEITMSTNYIDKQSNKLSDISSDGRVVMNVGTNMSIKDNTRIYFDFEKSFMGKINTDYQVNVGVRYSFGESDGYSPILEKADYKAPLKIEGEEKEGEESKENKENGEKIEGKESEGEAKSDKTKESKSDKAENTKTEKDLKENMQEQEEAKQTLEKESKTIKNNASKDKTTQRGEKK